LSAWRTETLLAARRFVFAGVKGQDGIFEMESTATQSSAIYFKRHKNSKRRAALFRQLRASPSNQIRDVKQQTFGNAHIAEELQSGQRWLREFAS